LGNIFLIDQEIFDDISYEDEFLIVERLFGIVFHLNIVAQNKFIKYKFYDITNTNNTHNTL
jgi:hypothetical protein